MQANPRSLIRVFDWRTCRLVLLLDTGYKRGADPEAGRWAKVRIPLENLDAIGFLSNFGPDPLENQATKPAFNAGSPSARQPNAILMAFRWWADDGLLLVVSLINLNTTSKNSSK